ncbi:MAG: GAF domain-containing protein, partial [Rhodospirillaceae bacterium]
MIIKPENWLFSDSKFAAFSNLLLRTKAMNSIDFISELVKGIGDVLDADLVFVSRAVDMPVTRARGIVGYKNGVAREPWEFDLQNNPCQLTYEGNPTFIPCDVATRFAGKKDSGFESYIGVPLFDEDEQVIGHLTIYSSKVQVADDLKFLLLQLCAS